MAACHWQLWCAAVAWAASCVAKSLGTESGSTPIQDDVTDSGAERANGLCDVDVAVLLDIRLSPFVKKLSELHFSISSGRLSEVVEIISVFQLDRLTRATLTFVEALRLTVSIMTCPSSYIQSGERPEDVVRGVQLSSHLAALFDGLRYLAATDEGANLAVFWTNALEELRQGTDQIEAWAVSTLEADRTDSRSLPGSERFGPIETMASTILRAVLEFVASIVEDTAGLYRTPNYLAKEMLPPAPLPDAAVVAEHAFGIFTSAGHKDESSNRSELDFEFMAMLRTAPSALRQPVLLPQFEECAGLHPSRLYTREPHRRLLPTEFTEAPKVLNHQDVSGTRRHHLSPLQLLLAIAPHAQLSNLAVSLQLDSSLLSPAPSCGSTEILYDPSRCLIEENWAAYVFHMNPLPPFNLTIVYEGKSLGPGHKLPKTDVHSIDVQSKQLQWSSLLSLLKSVNHHSPDMLFVNPFVANCAMFDRLLSTGTIKPKLAYLPFDPLEMPPASTSPDFLSWWEDNGSEFYLQLMAGVPSFATAPSTTAIWRAHCSLSALDQIMRRHRYVLLHVEHTYVVFMQDSLFSKVTGSGATTGDLQAPDANREVKAAWLEGWRCSPHARYLFHLESLSRVGAAGASSTALQQETDDASSALVSSQPESATATKSSPPVPLTTHHWGGFGEAELIPEVPLLRYFLEREKRGQCVADGCECYPPFRGKLCDLEDKPRVEQSLRAVIHYITAETDRDLGDLVRSLATLWGRLNYRYDYPVVIFHEGLSPQARERIISASENRVWLVRLPSFKQIPDEWARLANHMASEFGVGYRAMIRWRSGPVFLEPALASFDYAMTLDTDSYFPADVGEDPFRFLHDRGLVAAFPHLGRESASVVVNFMHYYLIYAKLLGLHPRRTRMLESLVEKNFKWYQQCLMLDIEILRLSWFRGQEYQDMFRYMDATGGFWLHRWGNNPFRTFAVGLLLEDDLVTALHMPYAHQDFCSCGPPGSPSCTWVSDTIGYRCPKDMTPAAGAITASRLAAYPLDEGLLDLQPWRGTERQRRHFDSSQVLQFMESTLS